MSEYQNIMTQIEQLKSKAEQLRQTERADALSKAKALVKSFELTATELGVSGGRATRASKADGGKRSHPTSGSTVAAKYRDGAGNAWSGRGLKPRWLTAAIAGGKKLEDFAV